MRAAFEAQGRFWKGNLHGHSTVSDGCLPPEEVCAAYRARGYDFVAVTDHFRADFGYPVTDTRACRTDGFTTLPGAELHAPQVRPGQDWHILAVGLPSDFAPPQVDEDGPALARRAAEAGAFVAIAHPHWYGLTAAEALTLGAAHAIEVYNHTAQIHTDRGDSCALWDALLDAGRRLAPIAVDDSHWHVDDAFGGWVMVKAAENAPEALLAALRAGRYYASQGPEIHDLRIGPEMIALDCSPVVSVILLGPGAQSRRRHGAALTHVDLSLAGLAGPWCRVVLVDAQGRRAWTAPLGLDD